VRDHAGYYDGVDASVIGISPDPVAAVRRFDDKFGLGFTLFADEDHAVADAYGTWVEKRMYGKTYWGVQRATFIIDADGMVAKVFPKVSPKTHDEVFLEALRRSADSAGTAPHDSAT
jgi:peroxiredoxin Q/BCP